MVGNNIRKCNQDKCCYYEENSGCPFCKTCEAEPNIINDNCDKCWNCENDNGILRNSPDLPEGIIDIQVNPEVMIEEIKKNILIIEKK